MVGAAASMEATDAMQDGSPDAPVARATAAPVCRGRGWSACAETDETRAATMTALTCILMAGSWWKVENEK